MDNQLLVSIILMVSITAYLIWVFLSVFVPYLFVTATSKNLASLVFVLWLCVSGIVASEGMIRDFSSTPPQFAFVIGPTFAMMFVLMFLPRFKSRSRNIPIEKLIGYQWYRFPLEVMLFLLASSHIAPIEMTFEGWNFDIVLGLTAPVVAWMVVNKKISTSLANMWNVLGIGTVTAVALTGIFSAPTQFQQIFTNPSNTFIVSFPFVWLATAAVPMALLGHAYAIRRDE